MQIISFDKFNVLVFLAMQIEPKDGYVCRKCWMKIDMWNTFYVHIEEIQGTNFKMEVCIDRIKSDVTSCDSRDLCINDDSHFYENNADDGAFVENEYFDADDDDDDDANGNCLI